MASDAWCAVRAVGGGDGLTVEIQHEIPSLGDDSDGEQWDPWCSVRIELTMSPLHPNESAAFAESIDRIRLSDVDEIVSALQGALAVARARGVLPPALTTEEAMDRRRAAFAEPDQQRLGELRLVRSETCA